MGINVGGEEAEAMSDINVTPLVDVMLVLLIIFIITIRVIIQQVQLDLPTATNLPTQTKPENITIAIDRQGDIYWNMKVLSGEEERKQTLREPACEPRRERVPIRRAAAARGYLGGQFSWGSQQTRKRKV